MTEGRTCIITDLAIQRLVVYGRARVISANRGNTGQGPGCQLGRCVGGTQAFLTDGRCVDLTLFMRRTPAGEPEVPSCRMFILRHERFETHHIREFATAHDVVSWAAASVGVCKGDLPARPSLP